MNSEPAYIPPNIEQYPFRPLGGGAGACQMRFQFDRAAAPETHIVARILRRPGAEGRFFYEVGIVNPHVPPDREGDKLTVYMYKPAEAKMLLGLPPDTMETEDGYIGPFDVYTMNRLMFTMQLLAIMMHERQQMTQGGGKIMPGMPQPS